MEDIQASSNDYEKDIARKVEDGSTGINLGEYFQEKLNIKPLLPYEGDTIIEGRFGNSVRFGSTNISDKVKTPNGWSDVGELGDPITIIKNGQSDLSDDKGWIHNIEDISTDASSIYMTSNQQLSNFNPASINQKSFGANLVIEPTIMEQLTGLYEEPPIEADITPQETDTYTPHPISSTPPDLPVESSSNYSDDPFGDYAEEILDNIGIMEISNITGTDSEQETYNSDNSGVEVSKSDIDYEMDIISRKDSNYKVNLHSPLSSQDLISKIIPQATSDRVKYLVIHTTAGNLADTHLDVAHFFMQSKPWARHGYHITIDAYGKCVQIYQDDIQSNGVGGANSYPDTSNQSKNGVGNDNTININWIGATPAGIFNITQQQAQSLQDLVKFYVTRYPGIKVLGHNQICNKSCPVFNVIGYCNSIGIGSDNIYQLVEVSRNLDTEFGTDHESLANITDLKHYS
jgi:hypothetical protein